MGERRKGREIALQILYLMDISSLGKEMALKGVIYKQEVEPKTLQFAQSLIEGIQEHMEELNGLVVKYSENWEMKRMAVIDRNIIRMGAYEILFTPETPVSVIIDEAVELAKIYSTDDSSKFVNGILDKIKNDRPETLPDLDGKSKI